MTAYADLIRFLDTQRHPPRETRTDDPHERSLATWLRYQRRRANRGIMTPEQQELLQAIPEFEFDPLNDLWRQQLHHLRRFLGSEKRMPRYRSSDTGERALAAWVHKQRHLQKQGKLSDDRVRALRRLPFRIV